MNPGSMRGETVYLGLGSNDHAERNLRAGVAALRERFGAVDCSPVYRSRAVGQARGEFLNACCRVESELEPEPLKAWLECVEARHGGTRTRSAVPLDIDILLFGDRVGRFGGVGLPRGEILQHAHVLKPLADLAPRVVHPACARTFADLWQEFGGDRSIAGIDLDLDPHGRRG